MLILSLQGVGVTPSLFYTFLAGEEKKKNENREEDTDLPGITDVLHTKERRNKNLSAVIVCIKVWTFFLVGVSS